MDRRRWEYGTSACGMAFRAGALGHYGGIVFFRAGGFPSPAAGRREGGGDAACACGAGCAAFFYDAQRDFDVPFGMAAVGVFVYPSVFPVRRHFRLCVPCLDWGGAG